MRLLYSSGLLKGRVLAYESDVKTDGILILAHRAQSEETARVNAIPRVLNPARVDPHKRAVAA